MVASFTGFGKKPQPRKLQVVKRLSAIKTIAAVNSLSTGEDWSIEEAYKSKIPHDLFRLNFRLVKGQEAVEILTEHAISQVQRVTSYATQPAARILEKCDFARAGCLVSWGQTLDGKPAVVPYVKPIKPRFSLETGKIVKYETPQGMPATPLLPLVNSETQQKIFNRYEVEPLPGESFWQTVWRCSLPILITEGLKKALSLLAHGYIAIALRGVTCWHLKGSSELHEAIQHFATLGRSITIVFDSDTKPKTVKNVSKQIKQLGKALQAKGCTVSVAGWNPAEGKGVDDVLFAKGDRAQQWLDQTIATAASLEEWLKADIKAILLRIWRYYESLGIKPERSTVGPHLPELPELEQGVINIITAPTGSGKTTRKRKWVRDWKKAGGFVLAFRPLNTLGKQDAESLGLPHRHDCGNSRDQQEAFRLLVCNANGVVACIDSLPRLYEFIEEECVKSNKPLLVDLDECNQVLESLNIGGTLKDRQAEVLLLFADMLKIVAENGAIVLSEARVNWRTVEQIKTFSGIDRVRVIEHKAERPSPNISILQGDSSGAVAQMMRDLAAGKKLICHVSSRNKGRQLEKIATNQFPFLKVLRIDSGTNQGGNFDPFWRDPDQYLKDTGIPDLLILSPSAKSGVSITEPGFDKVYGLFSCHYPSMWVQQLNRYRLPVPRIIWCPNLIPPSNAHEGYCNSKKVQQQLLLDLAGYKHIFGIAAAIDDDKAAEKAQELAAIQQAQQKFYADHQTSIGIEKSYPVDVLIELFQQEGHDIEPEAVIEQVSSDKEQRKLLTGAQEEIWWEDADALAVADPGDMTADGAHQLLNSSELTETQRWQALKVLYREEFPGIDFNDRNDCYAALTENFGSLRRGVLLQTRAANLDKFKVSEAEAVEAVLSGGIELASRLPRGFFKAATIKQIGLLSLLDGVPYQESDERIQSIKAAALHYANEIYKYFTLSIQPDQTGVGIANKFLRKLGLKAEVICKIGPRKQQVRIWGISALCDPIRVRLLKAATQKLGGDPDSVLTALPESYHAAVQAGLEARRSKIVAARDRAQSWQDKTSNWLKRATDKVSRLAIKLNQAEASGAKPERIQALSLWLEQAQEKLNRLDLKNLRAKGRTSRICLQLEAVGGNSNSISTEPSKPPLERVEIMAQLRLKAQNLDREDIQGATALLKEIAQCPGQWHLTIWALIKNLPGGWAINRAIKQMPELGNSFGQLIQSTQVICSTQIQEAIS